MRINKTAAPSRIPVQTRNSLKVLLLAGVCVGFFIFHIWFRTLVVTTGFEVGARRRELSKLESELIALKVERNRLMGPESLERLVKEFAAQGVHFSAPGSQQVFYVRGDAKIPTEARPPKTPPSGVRTR